MRFFLAQIDLNEMTLSWHKLSGSTRDGLVVAGALLAVTLIVTTWAVFIRKRKRRASRHADDYKRAPIESSSSAAGSKGRKWRRRRREHRPRNPTLAETGGLPPVRPPDQPV